MKRGKGVLVLTFWLIRVTHCVEDNSEFFLQDSAREKNDGKPRNFSRYDKFKA